MRAYDEMREHFRAVLACESLSDAERIEESIEDDGVCFAVYGPRPRQGRVIHDTTKLKRKKEAIEQCLQEMCHDGVNIFRVVVYEKHDDSQKVFPVRSKNGTVNELRYCLKPDVAYEIWLSLLSRGDENVHAYYTEYQKQEVSEGVYTIQQTFLGHKIACLHLTEDPDEFDIYRIKTGDSNTIIEMTFGTKPIGFDEVVKVFQKDSHNCVPVDLQVQKHLCKCFLVPEIKSKVERFRKMGVEAEGLVFELSTSTVNQVKVYIVCPTECEVFLWDKQGNVVSKCQAPVNTCTLVGITPAMLPNAWDMQHNEFHISLLGQNFPFYVTVGTPSTLGGGLVSEAAGDTQMDQEADIKVLLGRFLQI